MTGSGRGGPKKKGAKKKRNRERNRRQRKERKETTNAEMEKSLLVHPGREDERGDEGSKRKGPKLDFRTVKEIG